MLIRLLTIYLDLNLFNKDCLFKTKIKKNCNTKVSALFFPIIVVASSVNYSPLSSLCWLLGRFWRNFFERSLLFIGYFIVFIQRHPNLSDLICIFLKSHNIFILPYACDSSLSKKKSIIVTIEIFSQFKIDGLNIHVMENFTATYDKPNNSVDVSRFVKTEVDAKQNDTKISCILYR